MSAPGIEVVVLALERLENLPRAVARDMVHRVDPIAKAGNVSDRLANVECDDGLTLLVDHANGPKPDELAPRGGLVVFPEKLAAHPHRPLFVVRDDVRSRTVTRDPSFLEQNRP